MNIDPVKEYIHIHIFTALIKSRLSVSDLTFTAGQFHGIAHGVGHVLSVHEGPITIKKDRVPIPLQPGVIMSDEPGFYKEGSHGVRIENLIVFTDDGEGNIVNEPLTCVPYERRAINKDLLTAEEIAYIDKYHEWVRKTLTPILDDETAEWLKGETAAL